MKISRRTGTADDVSLARRVHDTGYRDVVVRQFGKWDQEQQERFFFGKWSPEEYEILLCGQVECGYLRVQDTWDSVEITEIVILPEYQNRGIGSLVLKEEMARAHAHGVSMKLQVLRGNRAVALYRKLGFQEYSRTETHIQMEWKANQT